MDSRESGNLETQTRRESIGKTETERMDSRLRGNDGSEVARNLKKPNGSDFRRRGNDETPPRHSHDSRHSHCFRHSHESGNLETQTRQESIGKTETEWTGLPPARE